MALAALLFCLPTRASLNDLNPFLLPSSQNCHILQNDHYYSCYSSSYKNSQWTLHQLERSQIEGSQARTNDYRRDNRVSNPVESTDYRSSGFDRGHLVPAADMKRDHSSMSQTFYMTNMGPQRPEFNRGIWSALEKKIRRDFLATGQSKDVFVYTGAILSPGLPTLKSGVTIPEWFYKIIYNQKGHSVRSYLIDNHRYSSSELESFRVSVDRIEELTKIDFFSHLSDDEQAKLESKI